MTEPRPYVSGFCNRTLPRTPAYDPHTRCRGCTCPCHQEDPVPIHIDTELQQQAAAGILTPRSDHITTSDTDPTDVLFALRSMVDQLNAALKGYAPDDWRDAVRLLDRLRRTVTGPLKDLDAALVHWLYLHGEHGLHQHIDGVPGEFSITRGRARERWEAPEAVRAYVEARIMDNDGEMPDPLQVVAWVLDVVPATASTSLRKKPLREAGVDVDDYFTSEPGSLQVSLPT